MFFKRRGRNGWKLIFIMPSILQSHYCNMIFSLFTLQQLWESDWGNSSSRAWATIKWLHDSIGEPWHHQRCLSRAGRLWDPGTRLPSAVQTRADTSRAARGGFSSRAGEPRQIAHLAPGHLGRKNHPRSDWGPLPFTQDDQWRQPFEWQVSVVEGKARES